MGRLAIDLVPLILLINLGAVFEMQGASGKVAEPQYPGVLLVSVRMSSARQVLVQGDKRLSLRPTTPARFP